MTSKEFQRKCEFYRVYAGALHLLVYDRIDQFYDGFWMVDIFSTSGDHETTFHSEIPSSDWINSHLDIDIVSIERYPFERLLIQVRYAKGFFSKLSQYQLAVIHQDSLLSFMYDYVMSPESTTRKTPPVQGRVVPGPSEAAASYDPYSDLINPNSYAR